MLRLFLTFIVTAASIYLLPAQDYWHILGDTAIQWDLTTETRLPHSENIEMSGELVSAIIYYDLDADRRLTLRRDVIFPQLRTYNKTDEPDWKKYRAYFRRTIADEVSPTITFQNQTILPRQVDSVKIDGRLTFYHTPQQGIRVTRTLLPAMQDRYLLETWTIQNTTDTTAQLHITNGSLSEGELGYYGRYHLEAYSAADSSISLTAGESYTFPIYYGATLRTEQKSAFDYQKALQHRSNFLSLMAANLILQSPDPVLNTLFYFSKIRTSESIFRSRYGLMHSPGGGNYYLGTWANDQVEYHGPFSPYLGYQKGIEAAQTTYDLFQQYIPTDSSHIPYSFEVDGHYVMDHLDRGDAAMISYGTAHYLLALGDIEQAKELWPLIEWCLDYCHKKRNQAGAVTSESDEMEGRIPTGTANLATSALYYGGLKYGSRLAASLGMADKAALYQQRQEQMYSVIEDYFGADMEGLQTYKYFDTNQYLRHWICLPLSMGIDTRQEGTIAALFDRLWTENGVRVELRPDKEQTLFWDRGTLYALQGALKVGAIDKGYEKLHSYSRKRLLGEHVPYVVEAYPENNMKHLAAESALYCRIVTEGLLGIEPTSLSSFTLTPRLPSSWDHMKLHNIKLMGSDIDITVSRVSKGMHVVVSTADTILVKNVIANGQSISIAL